MLMPGLLVVPEVLAASPEEASSVERSSVSPPAEGSSRRPVRAARRAAAAVDAAAMDEDEDEDDEDDNTSDDGASTGGSDAAAARAQRRRQVRAMRRVRGPNISARQGFLLALTEEEKELMVREGATIPDDADALSKKEMSALRAVARKVRNRLSAQESRQRKKDHVQVLEEQVKESTELNQELRSRVSELETLNSRLMDKLRQLQTMVASSSRARTGTGSCLLLLALSFSLFNNPAAPGGMASAKMPSLAPVLPELAVPPGPVAPTAPVDSIASMYASFFAQCEEERRRGLGAGAEQALPALNDPAAVLQALQLQHQQQLKDQPASFDQFVGQLAQHIDQAEAAHDAAQLAQLAQQQAAAAQGPPPTAAPTVVA